MNRTITAAQWRATPRDYRTTKGHQRFIVELGGGVTRLVPVQITKDRKVASTHKEPTR